MGHHTRQNVQKRWQPQAKLDVGETGGWGPRTGPYRDSVAEAAARTLTKK